MTKKEMEKQQKEAERQASVAIIFEELDNLPNIDIDPAAMLAKKEKSNSFGEAAETAVNVPVRPESKKHHGTLDLPIDLYERLRLFSFQQRRSINSVVEESLRLYLDVRVDTSV